MHPDPRKHHSDEDRVDALWDRINGTEDERSLSEFPTTADTINRAAISLLAAMVPPVEVDSLARIRQIFEAGIEKETAMSTITHGERATGNLLSPKADSSHPPFDYIGFRGR